MPDEIDLGDGVTAEFCEGWFILVDALSPDETIEFGIEAARKFCRFVEEKAPQEPKP